MTVTYLYLSTVRPILKQIIIGACYFYGHADQCYMTAEP